MKKIFFASLFILMHMFVNAQFSRVNPNEIKRIKQSVLLVELEQEDSKTLRDLANKKEQLEHYQAQIAGKNFALKNAVEKYWNLTDSIIFVTPEEIKTLTRNGDNYIVLKFGEYFDYERIRSGMGANGQPAGWQSYRTPHGPSFQYNSSTKQTSLSNVISTIKLSGYGGSRASIDIYLPNIYPSVSDMIYAIKQLQYTIGFYEDNPNASLSVFLNHIKRNNNPILKDKVLLLNKDEIHKDITPESLERLYPFKTKIVDQNYIDEVIENESSEYAYVQIVNVPGGKGSVNNQFVNCPLTGKIYCLDYHKVALRIKGTNLITYNERIKGRNLRNFSKNIK